MCSPPRVRGSPPTTPKVHPDAEDMSYSPMVDSPRSMPDAEDVFTPVTTPDDRRRARNSRVKEDSSDGEEVNEGANIDRTYACNPSSLALCDLACLNVSYPYIVTLNSNFPSPTRPPPTTARRHLHLLEDVNEGANIDRTYAHTPSSLSQRFLACSESWDR
jgi:hypothetical protein